ncbi:hypothetical protein [Flavobacterium limi]|uniref:DUF5018 domain-containing protein n=1 Tax=Flavobacterium limi TaxID=2045105 RepID=A0ABQ1TU58_9FLAO|nr:hypothetical protein [Flavobacterium limi]GGF03753.1 hypothetical protein GCM10011518_11130 [Flavobacterium limi]
MKNKLIRNAFLVVGVLCFWSCTKEEDVTEITTDQTKNKILSYKITNPGQKHAIYSAVNDEAKTITAYLPAYYQLEFMEVAIELPQGTTISPKADELVPVFSDKPFEYTVTATDGTTAKYKLNVVIQYPDMVLNELSTATVTSKIGTSSVLVTGVNILPSGAVTKLYLLDENGTKVLNYTMDETSSASMYLTFIAVIPNLEVHNAFVADKQKKYWLQIESYGVIKKMTYPVTFY